MNDIEKYLKKQDLILELHRFVRENGRVPNQVDMSLKNGYPSYGIYRRIFGTWNNALEEAGLKINKISDRLNGTETCSYCGKRADEISNHADWRYINSVRFCNKHGHNPDYVKGKLNINNPTGRGRAGEICVIKALKIGTEFDCNRKSCGYSFDMYHKEFGKIDVKTSVLSNGYNKWTFNFIAGKIVETYICIGMSSDTKKVEYVWIIPNEGKFRYLQNFQIYDTYDSLKNHSKWGMDAKVYDEAWKEMLENYTDGKCKVFSKKGE